jgi:hypothetical protein
MYVNGLLHRPAALTPGEEAPVNLEYEGGWVAEPVWNFGGKKGLLQ